MSDRPVFSSFDLHIGRGKDGVYPIAVQYSPAGETIDADRTSSRRKHYQGRG